MKIVEKIREEIEKRKNDYMAQATSFEGLGVTERTAYYSTLASNMASLILYIDSLSDTEKDFGIKEELKSKLKVKYANRIYDVVDCKELPGGIIYYVIEDESGHIDYINPDNCEVIEEPVSENTQFAQMADKYEQQVLIGEYQMEESVANHCRLSYYLGLKDGAQWQKERDQSTIELAEDHAYLAGQEKIIEKACEWLRDNIDKYLYNTGGYEVYIPKCGGKMFEDFKKAMEE